MHGRGHITKRYLNTESRYLVKNGRKPFCDITPEHPFEHRNVSRQGRILHVIGEAVILKRRHKAAAEFLQQPRWYHGTFRPCIPKRSARAFFIHHIFT